VPGASNAALLAAQIIGLEIPEVLESLRSYRAEQEEMVLASVISEGIL
jgi:phosphoribosylcarboxyaminoimidazole (NCAIR) mutase